MSVIAINIMSHLAAALAGAAIGVLLMGLVCANSKCAGWEHDGGWNEEHRGEGR